MKGKISDLLLNPDRFFSSEMEGPEDLRIPLLIVCIGGIAGAILGYITTEPFAKLYAKTGIGTFSTISGAVGGFFGFFISWIIITAIILLISMAFKGTGPFKRLLQFVGFGMIPQAIGGFLNVLIAPTYISRIVVNPIQSMDDIQAVMQAQNQVLKSPAFVEYQHISTILGLLFLLWAANIWIFGVKHARKLPLRQAAITVLVPVIIFAGISLYLAFFGIPGVTA